jgi:predicted KAP-like P-loop ATPase
MIEFKDSSKKSEITHTGNPFIFDSPIENEEEDILGRVKFSQELGRSLLNWKKKESLVVAIYGEWGSGKSSVINLTKKFISDFKEDKKPTVIEFNPWMFSDLNTLTNNFFVELSKQLINKKGPDDDKKLAEKLAYYSSVLNFIPTKIGVFDFAGNIFFLLGIIGITINQVLNFFGIGASVSIVILVVGLLIFILLFTKEILSKLSTGYEKRAAYKSKSAQEIKKDIRTTLIDREKKLLIIIDDIDRLNKVEIREMFRLIRSNADFPNTIYLLAFDRSVVERSLVEVDEGSGKDFLDKIVQVSFDLPYAHPDKILDFLNKKLNMIFEKLPLQVVGIHHKHTSYWLNIFHSGFKHLFKNIRDVKRFISGLEFNLLQMQQHNVLEVNPFDFTAMESIRIFAPDFYRYIKENKRLFTDTGVSTDVQTNAYKKNEYETALKKCPKHYLEFIKTLTMRLFPQVVAIMKNGSSIYESIWARELRVCSENHFDSYFTMIPGGGENELSNYEIMKILNSFDDIEFSESLLRSYMPDKKIRKVLNRLLDFVDDESEVPNSNVQNLIQVFFNIADDIPVEGEGFLTNGNDRIMTEIIQQLMKREKDKNKNFETLRSTIRNSKQLLGFVNIVNFETWFKEEGAYRERLSIPEDKVKELQAVAVMKIEEFKESLLKNKNLQNIIHRWKEWDENNGCMDFVDRITASDEGLLEFIEHFTTYTTVSTTGEYGSRKERRFDFNSLQNFLNLEIVKKRVEKIKVQNLLLFEKHKETLVYFLENIDTRNKRSKF